MMTLIDDTFPWFGDMVSLGGDVLLLIVVIALFMWGLILERISFYVFILPGQSKTALTYWMQRSDHHSWYAQQIRNRIILHLKWNLEKNMSFLRTLIKICPLLGLLGTVVGMLEVFDGMAATGNNSPKSTAAGVSKATVSTMAGMVVAISGLLILIVLERKATLAKHGISQMLTFDEKTSSSDK